MRKYSGIVIHSSRDANGVIDIVQDHFSRSLHFGTSAKQSSMYLHDPSKLALSYTRAMMSFLLFNPRPDSVLLIGLGGGSLAKFLHRHYPDCSIDAIEYRESVVKLAHGYFQLPHDDRIHIHIGDAEHYIRKTRKKYDAILVDAYDSDGMAENINTTDFFSACRDQLTESGILTANLWRINKPAFKKTRETLSDSFKNNVLYLPITEKQNIVALGLKQDYPARQLKKLQHQSIILGQHLDLELPAYLEGLRRHNTGWYEQLLGMA